MDNKGFLGGLRKFFLGTNGYNSGVLGWMIPQSWSKKQLLQQYARYAYTIISAIAQDSAKVEFEVGKKNAKGEMIPQPSHPFLQLMRRPNPMVSQFQFLEMHFTFMKLSGESYWYFAKGQRSGKPKEVYLIRPDAMQVVVDKSDPRGLVSGYVMNKSDGTKVPFEKEEILHHKMPNPMDPYYGYGPIQAGKVYLQTEEFASKWTRNSIYNSGRPSGVLNVKGTIDKEQFDSIKRQFKQEYSGTNNAGKTLLINGKDDVKYEKLGMELGEVALKELKDMTRDDIMIMFRLSKTILGITDDVNRANAQENKAVFVENVIKPELDRLVDHLNAFLMPIWGEGFVLDYEDPTLQSDKDRLEMWIAGYNKWLTINDIRRELDYPPLTGGDVIREPIQNQPVTEPTTNMKRLKKKVQKRLKGEVDNFYTLFYSNQALWEAKYQKFMKGEFQKQLNEILANHPAKAIKAEYTDWGFDVVASKARIEGTLIPYGIELMSESAKLALKLAHDTDTEFVVNERIMKYIHNRIGELSTNTNDLTLTLIGNAVKDGVINGESVTQIRNRIKEVFAGATTSRAEMIARTETLASSNQGALEAYKQSPYVTKLEWSVSPDACEFCTEMDGTIVGVQESFLEDGSSLTLGDGSSMDINYGNVDHPPLHPNCKCSILPVQD